MALPADPPALAAYLAERAEAGLRNGTLDGYCAAIAHRHRQEGLDDPTTEAVAWRVRRGLRRILGTAPRRQAHPLTVAELNRVVSSIDPGTAIGVRDRAVLLLGYASALRPREISALDIEDLVREPTGVLVTVRRSKTDRDGHGQVVGLARGEHRRTDPLRALDDWLEIRPAGPGALFTRVYCSGKVTSTRIGPRAVSRLVQDRADAAGLDGLGSAGTRCAPDTRPPPQPTVSRSTGSPSRPGTATSVPCSTTTSDPPRRSRPPPAASSDCDHVDKIAL